ncbi:Os03g0133875, partial [Oryza sativa Japonica Group]
ARWFTISPSGRVDVIICGRGGTRSRGPCQLPKFKIWSLLFTYRPFDK